MSNKDSSNIPKSIPLIREKVRGLAMVAKVLEAAPSAEGAKLLRVGLEEIEAGFKAIAAAEARRRERIANDDPSWPR